jgi:tRNA pseudouridine38-40 synthase
MSKAAGIRRWKCTCAYDGASFSGWQSQPGSNAVQDAIETRLTGIFGEPIRIHGSGRTDAGVHATGQVFHFEAAWRHPQERLLAAVRAELPPSIQIKTLGAVTRGFHARFSATGKRYTYDIHLGDADPFVRPRCWVVFKPLDLRAMASAAAVLVGRHDFSAFAAKGSESDSDDPGGSVRDLRRLDVARTGRRVRITAEADGFLYKMVRSLVGALEAVGEGKLGTDRIEEILASGRRPATIQTAPPQGLFLRRVFYGGRPFRRSPNSIA